MTDPDGFLAHFEVAGLPKTQGSMRAFMTHPKDGSPPRAVLTSQTGTALKDWRGDIRSEAQRAVSGPPAAFAVGVVVLFSLPRPPSRPASRYPFPDVSPDVDKLLRAALDAMTGIVFDDDKRVTAAPPLKRYAGGIDGGTRPGVEIWVWDERTHRLAMHIEPRAHAAVRPSAS